MSAIAGLKGDAFQPAFHHRIVAAQEIEVARGLPLVPGHQHHGGLPRHVESVGPDAEGDDVRDESVGALRVAQVGEPLVPERREIEEQRFPLRNAERIAEPAVALAVRAVGGHAQQVGAHRPGGEVVQPVDQRMRAVEPSGGEHRRVDDDRANIFRPGCAPQAGDFDAAEAVVGKTRGERFLTAACQDENVVLRVRFFLAVVAGADPVDRAVRAAAVEAFIPPDALRRSVRPGIGMKVLGVAQGDRIAAGTAHAQAGETMAVLAEIHHIHAGARLGDRQRGQGFQRHQRLVLRADHGGRQRGGRGRPAATVVAGLGPAGEFAAGVLHLPFPALFVAAFIGPELEETAAAGHLPCM